MNKVSAILLAGGVGSRMKQPVPKQFLEVAGQPLFAHSLQTLAAVPEVDEIVVVIDAAYRKEYSWPEKVVAFADPGLERQDSVFNGLQHCSDDTEWICVHDAARPCVREDRIRAVIAAAREHGAAVLGVPVKDTIKIAADGEMVARTLPRDLLWKVHTPQVLKRSLMTEGFQKIHRDGIKITDDVMLAEVLQQPVKLVRDDETNRKVTTPDDWRLVMNVLTEDTLV